MTVYVDEAEIPYRGMLMSHMVADSTAELVGMAEAIGLRREWIQEEGTYREHFDVAKTKRREAIEHGAVEVTTRRVLEIMRAKRGEAA